MVIPSHVVRDLGVPLDSEMTMRQHIIKIVDVCFYHLRRLKKVWQILGSSVTCRLVTAFVTSHLAYCNTLLAVLPQSTIAPLQRVQNATVRLVSELRPCKRLRDFISMRAPLASNAVAEYLQVVPDDAQCPHRSQSTLHNLSRRL